MRISIVACVEAELYAILKKNLTPFMSYLMREIYNQSLHLAYTQNFISFDLFRKVI